MKRFTKNVAKRRNERNILTFYEKIAVIRYYDETSISRNSLAKMFHCCATQIRRILERKEELLQQLATLSEADASIIIEEMTRKRRKFEMSAISFILHKWVERCRQLRLRTNITNQTLKDIALKMAAILNLPSFRPSYRWLNRFRAKYKYDAENLNAIRDSTVEGELSVEDIIIEFKDSLPSFMQKEISVITSAVKVEEKPNGQEHETGSARAEVPILLNENSSEGFVISEDETDNEETEKSEDWLRPLDTATNSSLDSQQPLPGANTSNAMSENDATLDLRINAGTTAVLNSVFPHLAVIHQFALLNSDVKALELISQLGVHMETQAAEGAYKQLSLAAGNCEPVGGVYADIDDIVLIE